MLADSDTVGKTNVPSTGKFILSSGRIRSGRHVLRIVSSDARGADSLSVVIGTIEVPMPPTITSSGLEGNVEQVLGLAIPGATVSLYIDGVFAGSAIVKPDGSFEIKSAGLAVGVHTVAADQTTVNGTSDKATAPAVEVTVPPPAAPTVTRTSVSGKVATVVGKGAPGATLTVSLRPVFGLPRDEEKTEADPGSTSPRPFFTALCERNSRRNDHGECQR